MQTHRAPSQSHHSLNLSKLQEKLGHLILGFTSAGKAHTEVCLDALSAGDEMLAGEGVGCLDAPAAVFAVRVKGFLGVK